LISVKQYQKTVQRILLFLSKQRILSLNKTQNIRQMQTFYHLF
jgi:hypothetical protein